MIESSITKQQEIMVKMVQDAWHSKTGQLDKLLAELTEDELLKEVAPGRNRGVYLLGHLTALADSIFPLLGYEKIAPQLFEPFVLKPDKSNAALPQVAELRQEWRRVIGLLSEKMAAIGADEWFEKHTAVSEEDFIKEPQRNKLNVVLSRVSHLDYHLGQMQFLKSKVRTEDFCTTIWVKEKPEQVFDTILDVRAWWSGLFDESFEGSSAKPGDEFSFRAGGGAHYTKQRLTELEPNKKVVWLVTESNLSFAEPSDEWTGTKLRFDISEEHGKTKVMFTHIGLTPEFECYDSCAPAWTQYMQERLVKAIEKKS